MHRPITILLAVCALLLASASRASDGKAADEIVKHAAAYFLNGDHARALAEYNEAIRLAPDHPIAYAGRAQVYEKLGELDKAVADKQRTLELIGRR